MVEVVNLWRKEGLSVSMGMIGSYPHKIDGKGRMVLPSHFRDELGEKVIATIGIGIDKRRFVSVYPLDMWEIFIARLDDEALKNPKVKDIRKIILASAHRLELDSAGRILIPSSLRTFASITQEVWANGIGDHIEIWDQSTWGEHIESVLDDAGDLSF